MEPLQTFTRNRIKNKNWENTNIIICNEYLLINFIFCLAKSGSDQK